MSFRTISAPTQGSRFELITFFSLFLSPPFFLLLFFLLPFFCYFSFFLLLVDPHQSDRAHNGGYDAVHSCFALWSRPIRRARFTAGLLIDIVEDPFFRRTRQPIPVEQESQHFVRTASVSNWPMLTLRNTSLACNLTLRWNHHGECRNLVGRFIHESLVNSFNHLRFTSSRQHFIFVFSTLLASLFTRE